MSVAQDEEFDALASQEWLVPLVTEDRLKEAMKGFALPFKAGRSLEWLTIAVRRGLALTVRDYAEDYRRRGNRDIKEELERVAKQVEDAWLGACRMNWDAETEVWNYSRRQWDGEGGVEYEGFGLVGQPQDFVRYKNAMIELEWLAQFLKLSALNTPTQKGPWRRAEWRRVRIERGHVLALIFEAAFGEAVSVNNWPGDVHHARTPFMEFYQRMVSLAFGERATPDLSGVLKTAQRLHQQRPASFTEGLIPGL